MPCNSSLVEDRFWEGPWTGPNPWMLSQGFMMSDIFPVDTIHAWAALPSLYEASLATKIILFASWIDCVRVAPSSGGKVILPQRLLNAGCRFWKASLNVLGGINEEDAVFHRGKSLTTERPSHGGECRLGRNCVHWMIVHRHMEHLCILFGTEYGMLFLTWKGLIHPIWFYVEMQERCP